jgi:phage/conjugal plasmid C-4 type zinc finger TraR family protein
MDTIDDAQGCNEDFQAFCLKQQQIGREPAVYTGSDCVDCQEKIPEARRKASPGCCRCIGCQEEFEHMQLHENWRPL